MNLLTNWNFLIDTTRLYRKIVLEDDLTIDTIESLHKCRTAIRRIRTITWLLSKFGYKTPDIKPLKVFFSLTSDIRDLDLLLDWIGKNSQKNSEILASALLPHYSLAKTNTKEYLRRKVDEAYLDELQIWATSTSGEYDLITIAKSLKIDAFLILEHFKEIYEEIFLSDDILLHDFRKEIKKIRYGYELLREEGFDDLYLGFKALQDKLGAIQDAVAWKQWLNYVDVEKREEIKSINDIYNKSKMVLEEFLKNDFKKVTHALNYDL